MQKLGNSVIGVMQMGENTKIEWATHTFNPWLGCSKVSPACARCYAEAWAKRSGLVQWGDAASRRRTSKAKWKEPLKWNEEAKRTGMRPRVFCASLADVFEDRPELLVWRRDLFNLIERTPNLIWMLLTKRPENLQTFLPMRWLRDPLSYVWLGTTAENQEYLTRRAAKLIQIPAALRFLSLEPLLGPINLRAYAFANGSTRVIDGIGWVIVGGESGLGARPVDPQWVRKLRDQCCNASTPFLFKQWGGRTPKAGGRDLDGREWNEFPQVLPVKASHRFRDGDLFALEAGR